MKWSDFENGVQSTGGVLIDYNYWNQTSIEICKWRYDCLWRMLNPLSQENKFLLAKKKYIKILYVVFSIDS